MYNFPESLSTDFQHERSVRRVATVLDAKRRRIRDDLHDTIRHMSLLVPPSNIAGPDEQPDIFADAADLLGDEAFAALLRQLLAEDFGRGDTLATTR